MFVGWRVVGFLNLVFVFEMVVDFLVGGVVFGVFVRFCWVVGFGGFVCGVGFWFFWLFVCFLC